MKEAVKTTIPLFILLVTVCMVTFSYAAFSMKMMINGDAIVNRNIIDGVSVTGVRFVSLNNASEDYAPTHTENSSTVHITLDDNSGTITYEVTLTNDTNYDFIIEKNLVTRGGTDIDVDKKALYVGRIISAHSSVTVNYTFTTDSSSSVSDDITIQYHFSKKTTTRPKVEYDSLIGNEILTIGKEKFIVVSRDATSVKALSLYNLNVGTTYTYGGTKINDISPYSDDYGKQNEDARGNIGMNNNVVASLKFGNTTTFAASRINVYDSQSNLYSYVQEYVNYLRDYYGVNVTGSVPTIQDMNNLGCDIKMSGSITNSNCNLASDAVTSSTYWTQTTYKTNYLHTINSDKSVGMVSPNNSTRNGLRAVITIPTSDVTIMQAESYTSNYNKDRVDYPINIIDINGEKFYKIREDGNNVIALSMYNLDTTNNRQYSDNTSSPITFSSSVYWGDTIDGNFVVKPYYSSLPAYVFNTDNSMYNYIQNYKNKLNSTAPNVDVRLMNIDDFNTFCSNSSTSCDSSKPYLYSTDYWTGIAANSSQAIHISSDNNNTGPQSYDNSTSSSIRPVIILNKEYIKTTN